MTVAITFIVLMLAGGVIAYLGDNLGYRIGKRRLSALGFRPRHTAQIVTVVSGVLIAAGTLATLILLDRDFRTAILEGPALIYKNKELKRENAVLEHDARSLSAKAEEAISQAEVAQNQAQLARTGAASDLKNLRTVEASLTAARAHLQIAQAGLEQKRTALDDVSQQLAGARAEQQQLSTRIVTEQQQLALYHADKIVTHKDALIYRNGQEVGRVTINASGSASTIRAELVAFLTRMSDDALSRGAAIGPTGRAVEINTAKIFTVEKTPAGVSAGSQETVKFTDESENLDALTDTIHGWNDGHGSVAVVAYALGNSFADKPVVLQLQPFINKLIYPKGTLVAETAITGGNRPVADILADIQLFLTTRVRVAGISDGVIPVVDPQEHSERLGDLSISDLFEIARSVEAAKGDVFLKAFTTADIYSADQLQVKISVEPVPNVDIAPPT